MTPEAQRLFEAYRAAWDVRTGTGRTDTALLFETLTAHQVDARWSADTSARALLAAKWEAGVPPGRLRLSLVRELPRLMYGATVTPLLALRRVFTDD